MSAETARYNRAARRREVAREMRTLIERCAALGPSNDESCPTGRAHACRVCGELFQCEQGCVAGDAQAWLRQHRIES